ncbi:hypothetical protein CAPTEDRAFT_105458 [Capitella teleta]|uniref:Uncharacterized protein n=1 Tax=Capitella teleta TaxID=283909 RepID=R7U3Z1_CAPTE|nr:hypothetical protein CAPTEDRAFT_105458 [Capitella teleta]|eukprot:ELU00841.1 hypothetical protein CAPTEDRAFT_105458 [Capitella teleta]
MRYVLPRKPITFAASEITGIRMERRDGAEVLMAHGQEVHAVPIRSLMEEFFRWVDGLKPAVMLAHNGRTFDFRILINALQSIDQLDEFCEHVTTFADTLPLFKKKVPGRRSYKLPILVEDILGSDYAAHDAMEDIVALSQLMTTLGITPNDIQGQSFTPHDVVQRMNYLSVRNQNLPSLSPLIEEGVCSMSLAEKLAGSGLQMQDLLGIYRQQGIEGLMATITAENARGTARVAGSPRVLHKFVSLLSAYFDKKFLKTHNLIV